MKVLAGTVTKEKALVWAVSVIEKLREGLFPSLATNLSLIPSPFIFEILLMIAARPRFIINTNQTVEADSYQHAI